MTEVIRAFRMKRFAVVVTAEPEYDTDLSWDETGETARRLDSGDLIAFQVKAAVYLDGNEIGADYLGGCIYESLADFMDHRECGKQNRMYARAGEAGRCGSYFAQMISEAIGEARKYVKALKPVYVRAA